MVLNSTLDFIAFLLLPQTTMAVYDPFCGCNRSPQVIGGTEEENQKLKDYFEKPGSSSIADSDDSAELEQVWYLTAKAANVEAVATAEKEYLKNITIFPVSHYSRRESPSPYIGLISSRLCHR